MKKLVVIIILISIFQLALQSDNKRNKKRNKKRTKTRKSNYEHLKHFVSSYDGDIDYI